MIILDVAVILVYFTCLIVTIVVFKKVDASFKWLCLLLWITITAEAIGHYSYFIKPLNSYLHYHIYAALVIPIHFFIYRNFLGLSKYWGWLRILFIVGFAFSIFKTLSVPDYSIGGTEVESVNGFILIITSLIVFLQMLDEPIENNLLRQPVFWFNTAVFFFYSTTNATTIVGKYLYRHGYPLNALHVTKISAVVIFYSLLALALVMNYKKAKHVR